MLYAALASFLIAATIGVIQLTNWINGKRPNRALPLSHGMFNVLGFALLLTYFFTGQGEMPTVSLVLFIVAALGGLFLFYMDTTQQRIPLFVAYIHGLVAITAIALLLVFIVNMT